MLGAKLLRESNKLSMLGQALMLKGPQWERVTCFSSNCSQIQEALGRQT